MKGILNTSCTCFIGACLQALQCSSVYINILAKMNETMNETTSETKNVKDVVLAALINIAASLQCKGNTPVNPRDFTTVMKEKFGSLMDFNQQNDASELLILILDYLACCESIKGTLAYCAGRGTHGTLEHCETKKLQHPLHLKTRENWNQEHKHHLNNPFMRAYGSQNVSIINCQACHKKYYNAECFNMMFVNPAETLEKSIYFTLKKETLDDWKCDSCKVRGHAAKRTRIWVLPRLLFICVRKCHDDHYKEGGTFQSIPNTIDMQPYCIREYIHTNYTLVSAICHFGSQSSGHYLTIGKNNNNVWCKFDDESVTVIDHDVVNAHLCKHASLFVFELCD